MPDDIKWAKFLTSMRRNKKILLIRAMPEGDALYCIWVDLILIAAEVCDRGYIYIEPGVLYDDEELGTVLGRHANIIRLAITTFQKYKMVKVDEKGIFLVGFSEIQNVEGMEKIRAGNRRRVANFRERERIKQITTTSDVTLRNVTVMEQSRLDKNIREKNNNIWNNVLLKINTTINKTNFNIFYKDSVVVDETDEQLTIAVKTEEIAGYIENNHRGLIEKLIHEEAGRPLNLKIVLLDSEQNHSEQTA